MAGGTTTNSTLPSFLTIKLKGGGTTGISLIALKCPWQLESDVNVSRIAIWGFYGSTDKAILGSNAWIICGIYSLTCLLFVHAGVGLETFYHLRNDENQSLSHLHINALYLHWFVPIINVFLSIAVYIHCFILCFDLKLFSLLYWFFALILF